jgi:hypothetical protein
MAATVTELITTTAGRAPKYNPAIGYLRASIVALVVAHHAVLAYHPIAPSPAASLVAQPRWWRAFPVSDAQRWSGFAVFAGFNGVFFMSLMFFLSGLFVWDGVKRKGGLRFLREILLFRQISKSKRRIRFVTRLSGWCYHYWPVARF